MVTIGIPVYNASRFLRYAIDSVLAQTCREIELIITIDGASDTSGRIAATYNDPRIVLIDDNENRGISFRLNQQISLARGKYFARMDADDIMFPDRIEKQLKFMLDNPEMDVTGSDAVVIDNNNLILGYRAGNHNICRKSILRKILFNHPTVFGKTTWFRENPYSSEFDGVEDFMLWNKSYLHSRFINLDEPLLFYRDPPLTDVSIYLNRQKQFRRAIRTLKKGSVIGKIRSSELITLSVCKEMAFLLLHKAGFSDFLIRRRNIPLTLEKLAHYSHTLDNLLTGKK